MENDPQPRRESNAIKGLIAGAVAGLVATWAMSQFQTYLKEQLEADKPKPKKKKSEVVVGHKLTVREKKVAGPAVHYAFGTLMGAAYGVTVELAPNARRGLGAPFGAGLCLSTHASALASHLVYGGGLEIIRRVVRRILG